MVRLNADLIWKSPHFFNATKERELDLRGNKIAIIENIGATEEKTEAAQKFHSKETEEAEKRVATKAYTPGQVVDSQGTTKNQGAKVVAPTPAQITAIKTAIVNSQTLDEVAKLKKALSTGQVFDEFVLPKPDTNMAQASEEAEAEKMETGGQDHEDGTDDQKQTDESTLIQESAIVNYQPVDELRRLEKEFLGADLDSMYDTSSHIKSYMYENFERAPFNFILSWRKRFFRGMHILPPPRRQEPARTVTVIWECSPLAS